MFCGNTGNILSTQDGGITWVFVFEPPGGGTPKALNDITFFDTESIWAVGANDFIYPGFDWDGTILFSNDSGENWSGQGVFSNPLNAVDFISSTSGWAVGDSGTILYTINGGVSFIDDETTQPTEFILSQNFPNPFNPSTVISFQLPVVSNVTLKVYDILGNEIATLVDDFKPAGRYEVEFNAAALPSGVYFYQLKAVDPSTGSGQAFMQTRKMILLK
jgi:hypothetical protein